MTNELKSMIIFDLACKLGHKFEGWFKTSEDFESQLSCEAISCPYCGQTDVFRVPSATHLGKRTPPPPHQQGNTVKNAQNQALLDQVLIAVLRNSEDVGREFSEEARRIHYSESPARTIHGEVTPEEFKSLLDDGIEVSMLPLPVKDRRN